MTRRGETMLGTAGRNTGRHAPSRPLTYAAIALISLQLATSQTLLAGPRQVEEIPAASGLQIQNLETDRASTVILGLHDASGAERRLIQRPNIAPAAAENVYLPAEPTIGGGSYAARLDSNGRVGVLVRTDDATSDRGALRSAAAVYRQPAPAEDVLLPVALKRYRGQSSRLAIQNAAADRALRARLSLVPLGATAALVSLELELPPAGSQRIDLARDPRLSALPDGFLGYARLRSEAGDGPLTVVGYVDAEDRAWGIYALEGLPAKEAGRRIVLPRIRHSPPRVSGIAVVNAGGTPATVELRYHALPGPSACGPAPAWSHDAAPVALQPGQQHVFYAAAPGPGGGPVVPVGCQAWAELLSDRDTLLAAVVEAEVDGSGRPTRAGAFAGVSASAASTQLFLPLFRRRHLRQQIGTPLSLVNPGAEPAEVRIEARDRCGEILSCGLGCQLRIPAGESAVWHPDAIPEPARTRCTGGLGFYGSAVVQSDQPLVLVAFEEPALGESDFAAYDALRRPERATAPDGRIFTTLLPIFDCLLPRSSLSVGCRRP